MASIPENLITLATHGNAEIPRFIRGNLLIEDEQLEHFSDYVTWHLLDFIPSTQKVRPRFGRIVGDPNRSPDAPDLFRDQDFQGNFLWHNPLDEDIRETLLDLSYRPYHAAIASMLQRQWGHANNRLLVADVHDYPARYDLPLIIISNAEGQTASPEIMDALRQAFIQKFNLSDHEVQLNAHYKGGYVTQYYGNKDTTLYHTSAQDRDVVQIEVNRTFYMDPHTEEVNEGGLADFAEKLTKVLSEVAYSQMYSPSETLPTSVLQQAVSLA